MLYFRPHILETLTHVDINNRNIHFSYNKCLKESSFEVFLNQKLSYHQGIWVLDGSFAHTLTPFRVAEWWHKDVKAPGDNTLTAEDKTTSLEVSPFQMQRIFPKGSLKETIMSHWLWAHHKVDPSSGRMGHPFLYPMNRRRAKEE